MILTACSDRETLFEAIKSGAQGYLVKNTHFRDLMQRLRRALQGEIAVTPDLIVLVWEEFRRLSQQTPPLPDEDLVVLTRREQEVLSLVAEGAKNTEVAEALNISLSTAKTHMSNVLSKLQVNNRHEAVQCARLMGLISRRREVIH